MGVQFALLGIRSFMLETDHAAPRQGANAAVVTQTPAAPRVAVTI
jgi:hypothetical protein